MYVAKNGDYFKREKINLSDYQFVFYLTIPATFLTEDILGFTYCVCMCVLENTQHIE